MTNSEELLNEIQRLTERLLETEETLEAMQKGEVDAILVKGPHKDQLYSINTTEHPYQLFIENMDESALILSLDGKILYANSGFLESLNYSQGQVLGSSIFNFIKEEHRPYFEQKLSSLEGKKTEISFVRKDQKVLTFSISITKEIWSDCECFCLLATDITNLKRNQEISEASEAFTKILSEFSTPKMVLKHIIEVLNKYYGWEVIVIWIKEKHSLKCVEIVHTNGLNIESFAKKTKDVQINQWFVSSHVMSTHRPYWIEDVTQDSSFIRRKEAAECHLKGVFAFPLFINSEIGGVAELFKRTPFIDEVDETMLHFVTSFGHEIGFYIERKIAEHNELNYLNLFNNLNTAIISVDLNGIVKKWNPGAEKIYGWKAQEIIGSNINKIFLDEQSKEFDRLLIDIQNGKSITDLQTQRKCKDTSKTICIEGTYDPVNDLFGGLIGISFIENDITAQKTASESLKKSEEKLTSIVEMIEEWIWEVDRKGNILFSNQAVYKQLGYPLDEVIGKNILYFLSFEDRKKIEKVFTEGQLQKKGWYHEIFHGINKDGIEKTFDCTSIILTGSHGKILGFRGVCKDITESLHLEKIKNEFISILSHELRTPLTTIHGALTLMTAKELAPQEQKSLITIAQKNSERLSHIINDIIDIEKFKLGKFTLSLTPINLVDVILESASSAEILAQKFGIRIVTGTLPEAFVNGDRSRLIQVMMNLLSNAIKFSPSKSVINISMNLKDDTAEISIQDFGEGIPKEFESKVFEKFAQADSSSKRAYEGTGLGLSICKSIIDEHRGSISFNTKIGEGTTFYFLLPLVKRIE